VFHVWSFVHHEGTFRFVGKLQRVADRPPAPGKRDPLEFRQSDQVRLPE
jgi:hypothetical protein